jgi:hypothetical protein
MKLKLYLLYGESHVLAASDFFKDELVVVYLRPTDMYTWN